MYDYRFRTQVCAACRQPLDRYCSVRGQTVFLHAGGLTCGGPMPTLYELVSAGKSEYDRSGGVRLTELSPARDCFACGHPWSEHEGSNGLPLVHGCKTIVYIRVAEDESEPGSCKCRRQRPEVA